MTQQQKDEYVRKMEIDPVKYYPPDVNRPIVTQMPSIKMMLEAKVKEKVESLKAKFIKSDK